MVFVFPKDNNDKEGNVKTSNKNGSQEMPKISLFLACNLLSVVT